MRMQVSHVQFACSLHLFEEWCLGCSVVKNPPANAGDAGSIPGSGRYPEVGNGNPH